MSTVGQPTSGLAIRVRLTALSTTMCSNACGFISDGAVSGHIGRPRALAFTRTCVNLACASWFLLVDCRDCSHESRMREIRTSGSARGECALPIRLLYGSRFAPVCAAKERGLFIEAQPLLEKTEGNELASTALIDLRVQSCGDLLRTRYWNCTRLLTLVMVNAHVGALLTRPKEIRLGYQPSSTLKKPEYSTRIGSLFPI